MATICHLLTALFAVIAMQANAESLREHQVTVTEIPAGSLLVDVRSQEEWDSGHVSGAIHLPVGDVEQRATSALPEQQAQIITYCRSGGRASRAAQTLRSLGYTNVRSLAGGGYSDLKAAGLPTSEAP